MCTWEGQENGNKGITMITVKCLKAYLEMLPPEAKVNAYEGEDTGLVIHHTNSDSSVIQSWFINAGPTDEEELTELAASINQAGPNP